jgi:hypothetical protein
MRLQRKTAVRIGMRAGIVVNVTPVDRRRLEAIIADRGAPQKHVWRAQIILATADGCVADAQQPFVGGRRMNRDYETVHVAPHHPPTADESFK